MKITDKDILCTDEYKMHHVFFFTILINTLTAVCTTELLINLTPLFALGRNFIFSYTTLKYLCISALLIDNIYETIAHLFATMKYLGWAPIVLMGTHDKQPAEEFAIATTIDIAGWILIFLYYGYANLVVAYIAGLHVGALVISLLFNKTFQKYYIEHLHKKDEKDVFRYSWWNAFRTSFVAIDGLIRGFVVLDILFFHFI